jgi:hypothetical protein
MKGTYVTALTFAATALLAASGCGGTTKSSSSTQSTLASALATQSARTPASGPLTRADLIAQADAICYRINAKRASIVLRSKRDVVRGLPQLASYEQVAVTELAKLMPPTSITSDWKVILVNAQAVAEATAKLTTYANTNPHLLLGRPEYIILTKAQGRVIATAKRDGFKDCARA